MIILELALEQESISTPSSVNYLASWPWTSHKALTLAVLTCYKEDHCVQ